MKLKTMGFAAILGLGVMAMSLPGSARAQDAANKFGRGFAGCTLGVLELPGNIYEEGTKNGWVMGATVGFGKGIGMVVVRTLVGVWELVTFPLPAPDEYNSILKPDYPWGYFTGEGEVTVPATTATPAR